MSEETNVTGVLDGASGRDLHREERACIRRGHPEVGERAPSLKGRARRHEAHRRIVQFCPLIQRRQTSVDRLQGGFDGRGVQQGHDEPQHEW
ncbi:MAG: hypothetical protein EXR71_09860 [Myxococcales bacterium]|nr:hypothetical protein [Myxococcales bacterium]